jgi:hypothetical protein
LKGSTFDLAVFTPAVLKLTNLVELKFNHPNDSHEAWEDFLDAVIGTDPNQLGLPNLESLVLTTSPPNVLRQLFFDALMDHPAKSNLRMFPIPFLDTQTQRAFRLL